MTADLTRPPLGAAPAATTRTPRRRRRLNSPSRLESAAVYVILILVAVIALFPFFWMLRTALTPQADAFSTEPTLLPDTVTIDNFVRVFESPSIPFLLQLGNTTLVSFATTVLVLLFGVSGAYALARLQFVGRRAFGMSLLLVQMFPGVLLVIPLFVVLVNLGLADSYIGLVLAYSTGILPFIVWFLRGYFLAIPEDFGDAARIDGCGHFGVLFRIVLPLARPGLAAAATLAVVSAWNEFLLAFVLINDADRRVLSVGLASFIDQFTADYSGLFAMASLTTVPIVVIFVVFQRQLVGGLAAGGVKG
jgi:arabinogalactan oligomer/maltooligosaccharide transport system permease protein